MTSEAVIIGIGRAGCQIVSQLETNYDKLYIDTDKEVIEKYNSDKSDLITRDSLIQRFEYTYSISLKMIKRYMSSGAFVFENVDGMTFNEMIRQANKMGLLLSNLEICL